MLEEIVKLRRQLHQHPELSGQEYRTAERIQSFIQKHHPTEIITGLGGNGLAACYHFSNKGPVVAIRCELDALPINEENKLDYCSVEKKIAHKCGHDGHMAIVAGLLFWLKKAPIKQGKVILLFQPAEETGRGAQLMLEDERFTQLGIDYLFALHNIPGEKMHDVLIMDKGFSAELQSFKIQLQGVQSHASEPEKGINPAGGIAQIIEGIAKLSVLEEDRDDYTVLTPVFIKMGDKAYGIAPADGEIHYTVRTWSASMMKKFVEKMEHIVSEICSVNGLKYKLEYFEHFPASKNNQECNDLIKQAVIGGGFSVKNRKYPFKFGEDFGWFSRKYKTAMFGLGAGKTTPALHHVNYDFPDDLIQTGLGVFQAIISNLLSNE